MMNLKILFFLVLVAEALSQGSFTANFYHLDKFGSKLQVAGAQPYALLFQWKMTGTVSNFTAGSNITFTSPDYDFFKVPAGQWAVQVLKISGTGGANCWANYTGGTTRSMTWTLNLLKGACKLVDSVLWQATFPPDFVQITPNPGYWTVSISIPPIPVKTSRWLYQSQAAIYAIADPRNSDDSASYLAGGGQPSSMNIGFTPTFIVPSGGVIQLLSSNAVFRRVAAYAFPIDNTGCTATLTTTGSGTTSQLSFTLSGGAACQLAQNVPVQFQLPQDLLAVHPVSARVTVTVNLFIGAISYAAKNGNPAVYTTTDGCSEWSAWSSCSATCGSGYTYHTRGDSTVACPVTIESRVCNTISCGCTAWSEWGSCSATCGGTISRYRQGSVDCNVATEDTQTCGPTNCNCPWTQTSCSSSCGSGVRSRAVTPVDASTDCGSKLNYDVVCNETFITESLSCPCVDVPWTDRFGNTCADYVANQWCTSSGDYGPGWDFTQPGFRSFDYRTQNGNNALSACCGCGKNRCVKDVVLLVDQSASIAISDWQKTQQYLWDRVNQTKFTDEYGNRIGVVQFDVASSVLCPLTWNQTFLLRCIEAIWFPSGSATATSAGLDLAYTVFDRYSSPSRTRVIELLTDGSPNVPRPDSAAEQAAYDSAYALKDAGVTILTMGMGIACATPTSTDCLNQGILNRIASEPASSYAVLLSSYSALKAMSLFISTQCQAKFAGFDPSPSPRPQFSPEASASPSPASLSPSPFPSPLPEDSPFPSPSPDGKAFCSTQEDLMPSDWHNKDFP
eukprot:EG_transcript_3881